MIIWLLPWQPLLQISAVINPFLLHVADVKQDMLETIIPKNDGDSVMVVLGEHRGQVSLFSLFFFPRSAVTFERDGASLIAVHLHSGRPDPSEGQKQVQSDGAAQQIRGEAVHAGL